MKHNFIIRKFIVLFWGLCARIINIFFSTKKGVWIFGAQFGQKYVQNSKYLFEYVLTQGENAYWVTKSIDLFNELKKRGMPVLYQFSLKAVIFIAISEYVVVSTSKDDVYYNFKRKNKKFVNLFHGMPMKKIIYDRKSVEQSKIIKFFNNFFISNYRWEDCSLIISTSPFFSEILKRCFRCSNVHVLGQARTDVFYTWNKEAIKKKLGFKEDEFLILYMPTHRAYGKGKINPSIFQNNAVAIDYFRENNIKIIWKFHINMINKHEKRKIQNDVFVDLTESNIDAQELLFISDILITDYSSCFIDYQLLNRPIIFYLYDNYVEDDNEVNFRPDEYSIGEISKNENELLMSIKKCKNMIDPKNDISLFHTYCDGNSCKRIYNYLKDINNTNSE